MADFNSKYTGEQVEEFLDQIANGEISGGITVETDPIFSNSPAASITNEKMTEWNNKVDKVSGKQLSTEDFTTTLKQKLDGLSNYDDTQINEAVESLQTQLNTLVSGNASNAIESFNEIIAFLNGIEDSQSLDSIVASIEQQIASKVDSDSLATVATSGSYNDLSDKPTIPTEVTESTVSGWGFTKNTGTYSKPSTGIPASDLASSVQTSLGKADTALQSHQDISGKQDKLVSGTNIKTINNTSILGSGNISITGGSGTITEVKANGTSIATSGVANIPAASTSAYGVTKLSSVTNSTSEVLAATPKAVKSAYDLANGKVSKVKVNGVEKSPSSGVVDVGSVVTSVKVNGTSNTPTNGEVDLGIISGGSASGYPIEYYTFLNVGTINIELEPHKYYIFDNSEGGQDDLIISLPTASTSSTEEFVMECRMLENDILFPADIVWVNNTPPNFSINPYVIISIAQGIGLWCSSWISNFLPN